MQTPRRVAVVVGSTRPTRIGPDIAGWVHATLDRRSRVQYEIVDLAAIDLPLLDEPEKAATGHYEHAHTRAWSELVSSYDGFVFVLPQYNWGYPGVLKNALDFLYAEWRDKPASFLTYGARGGNRAAAQFATVLQGLHMRVLATHVEAVVAAGDVDGASQLVDATATLAPCLDALTALDEEMSRALLEPAEGPVGGEPPTRQALVPPWETRAAILDAGDSPARAAAVKLLQNQMLLTGLAVVAETVRLGRASGLDDEELRRLLTSSPMLAPGLANRVDGLLSADHAGWFTGPLAAKDLDHALGLDPTGAHHALTEAARDGYAQLATQGWGEADVTALVEVAHPDRP